MRAGELDDKDLHILYLADSREPSRPPCPPALLLTTHESTHEEFDLKMSKRQSLSEY